MSETWVYQKNDDVKKLGEENAPWLVGWYEPDGRRRSKTTGPGKEGKKLADRLAKKLTAELMTGTYQKKPTVTWDVFVTEYTTRVLDGKGPRTKETALVSLAHFKRIASPVRMFAVNTGRIDDFIAARRKEQGKKKGEELSPASLNKDLRHIKAAIAKAVKWGYVPAMPDFSMERTAKKMPRFMTGEHFTAIYAACDVARMPANLPYPAADWWRGLLVMAYMTGWRISDLLALRRDDLDLDSGYAVTQAEDNKGNRDDRVKLHPLVIEHLKKLASFEPVVFPWYYNRRTLDVQFDDIQTAAGIDLPCRKKHEHTDACHRYGFHDLRRAFATMNAERLTPDALQALMRHKSYLTTQVYINLVSQLDEAVNVLEVPKLPRPGTGEQKKA